MPKPHQPHRRDGLNWPHQPPRTPSDAHTLPSGRQPNPDQPGTPATQTPQRSNGGSRLSKRGWIATLTAKNTPDVDVLASRPIGDVHARIQVKTRSPAYLYAHRVGKRLRLVGDRDFLVLVHVGTEEESPSYWIIPTLEAVGLIKYEQIRTRDVDKYQGRWDLLG